MKIYFIALALLTITATHASECTQNEAQFIGKVVDAREIRIDQGVRDCFVKIAFSLFNPNIFCPLDESLAARSEILDFNCDRNLEVDQEVSGVLIEKNDILFLEE